ncbi:hypothetical protein JCM6882_000474 [Rhodosporidiobolus microsporus]
MVHFSAVLLPLAALASTTLAVAAPPNPDQLYHLQASAESVAATASASSSSADAHSHGHASHGRSHHDGVKRHLDGANYQHARRGLGGMQRRPASERERRSPGGAGVNLGGRNEDLREREKRRLGSSSRKDRRGVIDSSETPDDEELVEEEGESDLAARDVEPRAGDQYYLATTTTTGAAAAGSSAAAVSTRKSPATGSAVSTSSSASDGSGPAISGAWKGVSSYYLFALNDDDRIAVLDAIKGGGFKVIRIFVSSVMQNNKGSGNAAVNDIEQNAVGAYDDTILTKIDQLMVECKARGLKLLIALGDRYSLGFWHTDAYALKLNIVKAGSSGVQKVANAASFYTSSTAIGWYDARLKHIMAHKNSQLGKTWAELDEVIYAVEPQNEPQGHMAMASSTWACDRAKVLKSIIPSSSAIKVSTGGGITTTDSLGSWAVDCSAFDIVSVHDYGTSASNTANALAAAQAKHTDKEVIMGEWGMSGANKAALISQFVSAFADKSIPQMYWEVVRPGKAASDFEVWTDEPAWKALTGQQYYSYVAAPASTSKAAAAETTHAAAQTTQKPTTQWYAATSSFSSKAAAAANTVKDEAEKATSKVVEAADKATSKVAEAAQAAQTKWTKAERRRR